MEIGEVLIVNHGLKGSVEKKEDNLVLQHKGISEIRKWYSAVILDWCGYACVSRKGKNKQDFIVSKDIDNVIEVLQKKLSKLKPEGHGELPIIINSVSLIPNTPTVGNPGSIFLARRILSGNEDSNKRSIALVRHRIAASENVMSNIRYYKKQYPQLDIILHDRPSFLESMETNTHDVIFLPERSKWTYVIDESSLKENPIDEDEDWTFSDIDFPFCKKKKKQKLPKKRKILFSEEEELKGLGLKTLLEICETQKTLRCGPIWTDGYDGLSMDTLERIIWCCHLDINIPDFLSKCPKV